VLNTPAFFAMLPEVKGLSGIDIGCGEGHNTRLLANRGARVYAVDIASVFINHAREAEGREPLGIRYTIASAVHLPFADHSFDFATGFMSFMDIPERGSVLAEAYRVLKAGGFLQFSITHPCFDTPHRRNVRGPDGQTYAIEVGNYFDNIDGRIDEWIFTAAPLELRQKFPKFRVPRFHTTISNWLNAVIDAGFAIERLSEPRATDDLVRAQPHVQDTQVVPYFLHIRARK
jgi:SAM-dependent methyltransferase